MEVEVENSTGELVPKLGAFMLGEGAISIAPAISASNHVHLSFTVFRTLAVYSQAHRLVYSPAHLLIRHSTIIHSARRGARIPSPTPRNISPPEDVHPNKYHRLGWSRYSRYRCSVAVCI